MAQHAGGERELALLCCAQHLCRHLHSARLQAGRLTVLVHMKVLLQIWHCRAGVCVCGGVRVAGRWGSSSLMPRGRHRLAARPPLRPTSNQCRCKYATYHDVHRLLIHLQLADCSTQHSTQCRSAWVGDGRSLQCMLAAARPLRWPGSTPARPAPALASPLGFGLLVHLALPRHRGLGAVPPCAGWLGCAPCPPQLAAPPANRPPAMSKAMHQRLLTRPVPCRCTTGCSALPAPQKRRAPRPSAQRTTGPNPTCGSCPPLGAWRGSLSVPPLTAHGCLQGAP